MPAWLCLWKDGHKGGISPCVSQGNTGRFLCGLPDTDFACSHEDALLVMHVAEGPLQVSIGCVLTTDTWPFGMPCTLALTPVGC